MSMSKKRQAPGQASTGPTASSGTTDAASTAQKMGGGSNAFMQKRLGMGGDSATDTGDTTSTSPEGASEGTARVTLSAKKGGSPFSSEFWTDLNVGHCWVDVVTPEGKKESWGYTAQSIRNFPRYQPWKSVPGRMLHPDGSRGASGTLSRDVSAAQLEEGEDWGMSVGHTYNLFGLDGGHSCATFAKGFFEAATGDKAPTGMFGAIIANPNDLSAAMNKQAEKERPQDPTAAADDD
jgi:hypothetical protein